MTEKDHEPAGLDEGDAALGLIWSAGRRTRRGPTASTTNIRPVRVPRTNEPAEEPMRLLSSIIPSKQASLGRATVQRLPEFCLSIGPDGREGDTSPPLTSPA
jgi:hypothetical protein